MTCGSFPQWFAEKWTLRDGLPAPRITAVAVQPDGTVVCLTPKGAAAFDGRKWSARDTVQVPGDESPALNPPGTVPWLPVTCWTQAATGELWVGTPKGLCRYDGKRWRAFHSLRWLPNDKVNDVVVAPDGSAWVATEGGVARIAQRSMTLAQKAAFYEEEIRKFHNWRGLIREISLPKPGQLEGYRQPSSDNDGLWTSLYVAAESFRYAATRDPEAKANATESMKAMLFLEEITSLPGFVARSYLPRGEGFKHGDGVWYPSKDGKWDFKGDTSSDEIDGHFYAYGIYHELVDDPDVRRQVVETARRVMDRIIRDGYYLVGPTGKRTTWGVWAPRDLNDNPRWMPERGLNSLELLSYLKTTEHITGDEKYRLAARELIDKHHYALNTIYQKIVTPVEVNHSDDELAFVAYHNLLWFEKDPKIRKIYVQSIERSWKIEQPEQSPFYNFIYGSAVTGGFDLPESIEWLKDAPLDTIRWTVDNTGRRDVPISRFLTRFGKPQTSVLLPVSERPVMRWNGNPYDLRDGGGGHSKLDGTFWLLPYWMGRYCGFIVE